ncbi:peptidoglycan-binding protein [Xylanimonas oleitrophica]|uniref:Peptidoglycan-binding protein n=1 Tax=Xylanimonas oleitrophica TaxID=2607479 RepID=A0A2W5WVT6_9MICO|nr:LysM peptidoglycan-binding domain-containing protein [Xylanimonas oleitrophica]PZR55427.1 peptidoglycan-binding protein [Xylanimonas oleitrophica]
MAATTVTPVVRPDRHLTLVQPGAAAARASIARASARDEHPGFLGLGGLRPTRRGRVVLVLLATLLVAPFVGMGAQAAASDPQRPLEVRVHTVAPGETLWGFATQLAAAGQDVRDVVAELREINELRSAELRVGQAILLPVE